MTWTDETLRRLALDSIDHRIKHGPNHPEDPLLLATGEGTETAAPDLVTAVSRITGSSDPDLVPNRANNARCRAALRRWAVKNLEDPTDASTKEED